MHWSLVRSLADSKIVRSSYIWLLLVPLAAKALSTVEDVVELTIFGETFNITMSLPFSWQLIFYASCAFTIANIVYFMFCPDLFKSYRNYTEFKDDGKTLLQVHSAMKNMVWDNKKPGVKPSYIKFLSSYFKYYCGQEKMTEEELDLKGRSLFDDIDQGTYINVTNNAFYFVHKIANSYNKVAISTSAAFYGIGLLLVLVIAVQNIIYVAGQNG